MCTIEATYGSPNNQTIVIYDIQKAMENTDMENQAEFRDKIINEDFTIWQGCLYMVLDDGTSISISGEIFGETDIITSYDFTDIQPDLMVDMMILLDAILGI